MFKASYKEKARKDYSWGQHRKTNVIYNTSQFSIKDEARVMPPNLITQKNKEQYINVDKMWGGFL